MQTKRKGAGRGRSPRKGAGRGRSPRKGAGRGRSPRKGAGRGRSPRKGAGRGNHGIKGGDDSWHSNNAVGVLIDGIKAQWAASPEAQAINRINTLRMALARKHMNKDAVELIVNQMYPGQIRFIATLSTGFKAIEELLYQRRLQKHIRKFDKIAKEHTNYKELSPDVIFNAYDDPGILSMKTVRERWIHQGKPPIWYRRRRNHPVPEKTSPLPEWDMVFFDQNVRVSYQQADADLGRAKSNFRDAWETLRELGAGDEYLKLQRKYLGRRLPDGLYGLDPNVVAWLSDLIGDDKVIGQFG